MRLMNLYYKRKYCTEHEDEQFDARQRFALLFNDLCDAILRAFAASYAAFIVDYEIEHGRLLII